MRYRVYVFVDEVEIKLQSKFYIFIINLKNNNFVRRWCGPFIAHKKLSKQLIDELFSHYEKRDPMLATLCVVDDTVVIKYVKRKHKL